MFGEIGRFGAGFGRAGAGALSRFTPLALYGPSANGDFWDGADLGRMFQVSDGTTAVTAAGDRVGYLGGRRGAHNFIQATAGNRPTLRQRTDGTFYLEFASGQSMAVASSTALFKYLHDGNGGTLLALIEWNQSETTSNFLRTSTGTSVVGITLGKISSTQSLAANITRGVAGVAAVAVTASGIRVAPSSRLIFYRQSYKNDGGASDFRYSWDSSRQRFDAATANAPSANNAAQNLTIESTFVGNLYALLTIDRVLTEAEVQAVYAYWRAKEYAIPTPDLTLGVGGQSNAASRATLNPTVVVKQDGVFIFDRAEEYRLAYEPTHSILNQPIATSPTDTITQPGHSFLLTAGKALKDDANKTSIWVPGAVGSTAMAQWDTPLTAPDRTTLFGAYCQRFLKVLSEKGGDPVIVWYGHEADAALAVADLTNGGVGTDYQTAWASLIASLRAVIGANTPVVFCQLAADDTLATAVAQATAGEAQRQTELTVANSFMVVTHDLARNASTDDIHLSRSQEILGERLSLCVRENVLGEVVNGTGPRIVGATYADATVTLEIDKDINTTAGDYDDLFRVYDNGVEATVSSANRNGGNASLIDIVCSASLSGPVTLTYGHRAGPATAARTDFVKDTDNLPLPLFGPIAVAAAA